MLTMAVPIRLPTNQYAPLLIRAEADARMGTGHVLRCLALGQSWQRTGGGGARKE
jgi:hypothetical protein